MTEPQFDPALISAGAFDTTHWSVVVRAQESDVPRARDALSTLCMTYWYPLYCYLRSRLGDADRAQDVTQEFFVHLLDKDVIGAADRNKGGFRGFLLACCKNFLASELAGQKAKKRGGGRKQHSLDFDFDAAGRHYRYEPAHDLTPERLFEKSWALTLLDRVVERLKAEFTRLGKGGLFEELKPILVGGQALPYAEIGRRLLMSEDALKKAAERLRKRYRTILQEEVAQTVEGPDDVRTEVQDLFAALSGG